MGLPASCNVFQNLFLAVAVCHSAAFDDVCAQGELCNRAADHMTTSFLQLGLSAWEQPDGPLRQNREIDRERERER